MKDENGLDVVEKETVQYIVVSIGNEQYGLDISYVDNIVRMCKITRVPKAPAHYIGVINLRGEIVPLMSLRRKMNLEDDVFTDITRIIILKTEEQGLVGIVVDEVKEVIALAEDEIDRNTQNSQSDKTQYINGIGKNVEEGQTPSMIDTQLYLMTLSDKKVRALTKDFYPNVLSTEWSKVDGNIYFTAEDKDCGHMPVLNCKSCCRLRN